MSDFDLCFQSYMQITGSDLVLEVDSNNVICNTKITSNNRQLWKLMYTWTDDTFQILLATSQQLKMTYGRDLGLAVVCVAQTTYGKEMAITFVLLIITTLRLC